RLGPALWVTVLWTTLWSGCFATHRSAVAEGWAVAPWVVTGLVNWKWAISQTDFFALLLPTWSLAVEYQFYLAWPLLLPALNRLRMRRRWLAALVALGMVAPVLVRAYLWDGGHLSTMEIYLRTDTRMDALFWGCGVALVCRWHGGPSSRWARLVLRLAA